MTEWFTANGKRKKKEKMQEELRGTKRTEKRGTLLVHLLLAVQRRSARGSK